MASSPVPARVFIPLLILRSFLPLSTFLGILAFLCYDKIALLKPSYDTPRLLLHDSKLFHIPPGPLLSSIKACPQLLPTNTTSRPSFSWDQVFMNLWRTFHIQPHQIINLNLYLLSVKTVSFCIAQADLSLGVLLPLPLKNLALQTFTTTP